MVDNKDKKKQPATSLPAGRHGNQPSSQAQAEGQPREKKTKKTKEVKKEVKISVSLQKIIDQVEKLSVLELAELVKALEDKFGVSATAPVTVAAAAGEAGGGQPAAEEKSEYKVVLATAGSNKIAIIKTIREIKPDLGLKDAKDLVDNAPKTILESATKEQAEAAKAKLEAAGAQVELK